MKPIRTAKKLTLTTETLRRLTPDQLGEVNGGTFTKLPASSLCFTSVAADPLSSLQSGICADFTKFCVSK